LRSLFRFEYVSGKKGLLEEGEKGEKRKRLGIMVVWGRVKLDVDERFGGRQKRSSTRRYEEDRDGHYVEKGNLSMKSCRRGFGNEERKNGLRKEKKNRIE